MLPNFIHTALDALEEVDLTYVTQFLKSLCWVALSLNPSYIFTYELVINLLFLRINWSTVSRREIISARPSMPDLR